jgi:hypothetical protein
MLQGPVIILTSFAYLGLLFAIAYYADQRADAGRPAIASPYIYSLSLAVYAGVGATAASAGGDRRGRPADLHRPTDDRLSGS